MTTRRYTLKWVEVFEEPHYQRTGWDVRSLRMSPTHAVPIGDIRAHLDIPGCWCGPSVDGDIYVHHALDGRQFKTRGANAPEGERERLSKV